MRCKKYHVVYWAGNVRGRLIGSLRRQHHHPLASDAPLQGKQTRVGCSGGVPFGTAVLVRNPATSMSDHGAEGASWKSFIALRS